MGRRFIDLEQACMIGLCIKAEQVNFFNDNRKTLELRQKELQHLATCTICNPTLLAEQWFGKPVTILTEVHHE